MIAIYRTFQQEAQQASDSQLIWMRNDQQDTLASLPKGNHLRDKHIAYLELAEAEITARGL